MSNNHNAGNENTEENARTVDECNRKFLVNITEENIGGNYQRPILKAKQDNPRPKPTTGCARS